MQKIEHQCQAASILIIGNLSRSQSTAKMMVTSSGGSPTVSSTITIVTKPAWKKIGKHYFSTVSISCSFVYLRDASCPNAGGGGGDGYGDDLTNRERHSVHLGHISTQMILCC